MNNVIIFSHDGDIDGMGCIVLAKLAFKKIDYVFSPGVEKLEIVFRNYLETGKLNKYGYIYVTDLSLYNPTLTMLAESKLKDTIRVFDHHIRAIKQNMNRYSFTTVIDEEQKKKALTLNKKDGLKYLADSIYSK